METARFTRIFEPIKIGRVTAKNRIVAPPHAAMLGNLFGTEAEAARYTNYWRSLAEGGTGWLVALNGFVENIVPPGFDPTGIGSRKVGVFRNPLFVERMGALAEAVHAHGAVASTQLIMQGGMPHGPSQTLSGPVINSVPHALNRREIRWFVNEYRHSAQQALAAGLDSIELHANHDDLIEWFLSPLTNLRTDEYGGTFAKRMTFLGEILAEIREAVGDKLVISVRLNMEEPEPGGYDLGGGLEIATWLQETGFVDCLHLVVGTGWGFPSYIQTHHYEPGAWAELAGKFRAQLKLPIIHAGRVNHPRVAERILEAGLADMVGVGRAHLADPNWVNKTAAGDIGKITPCIGCNDCINRGVAEGLPFACTVNPRIAGEDRTHLPKAAKARRVLIAGGGPAGMQLAITARERGHDVELWEKAGELGGQVRLSAKLPTQAVFLDYVGHQQARLAELDVRVRFNVEATPEALTQVGADVVAIATGAAPRRPVIPGVDGGRVYDAWQILNGEAELGARVAVIVQDDHAMPLALADHLAGLGKQVTMFIQTNGPAPHLSRYMIGTMLGRLSQAGVEMVFSQAVTEIALPTIRTRHVYSQRSFTHGGFDSVALACGGVAQSGLYEALHEKLPEVHVLGDAYAPRRMVFATQQGHELGKRI